MVNWISAINPPATYISKPIKISAPLNTIMSNVTLFDQNDFDQTINYYYRFSKDEINWTEWFPLFEGEGNLFGDINATVVYFQYRVEMFAEELSWSPKHMGIRLEYEYFERIVNKGDLKAYPKLWINKRNNNNKVKLINTTNREELSFKKLNKDEEVFIDTYDEIIISSQYETYRYDDHNNVWLTLEAGENLLQAEGDFDLDVRYYAPMLQD